VKVYRERKIIAPVVINLSTRWRRSASHLGHFTPGERTSGAYCMVGREGPTTGLYGLEKRKISFFCMRLNRFFLDCPEPSLPTAPNSSAYRGADKSLARATSRCILFDGETISCDASLVIYINSTNIRSIMIVNGIY
jgi:hypothetical protein